MEFINATIATSEQALEVALEVARECYPIGQPVEVISGETVVAREYRKTERPDYISFRYPTRRHEMIRLEVWGEIHPACPR